MGLFRAIKELFEFRRTLKRSIEEEAEREAHYLSLSCEALAELPDDELFSAAVARTEHLVDEFEEIEDGLKALNESQKIFYSLNWLEVEVNNGGLCQFFVNSSRAVAPFVSGYMATVGAEEHRRLFDGFIGRTGIDLCDLSSFDVEEVEEFENRYQRYPFDEYDDAYYEMEPIQTYLTQYVRAHVENF